MSNQQPEDMSALQDFLSPIPSRAEKSGNNCRKRGIYRDGTNIYGVPPLPLE